MTQPRVNPPTGAGDETEPSELRMIMPAHDVLDGFALTKPGSAHVVSLEPLRAALADRWDRKSDQIKEQIERYFARHLGTHVFVEWIDATQLLIVHPDMHELAARISCVQATAGLMRHFLGAAPPQTLRLAVVEAFEQGVASCRAVTQAQVATILAADDPEARRARVWDSVPVLARLGRNLSLSIVAEPILALGGPPKPVATYLKAGLVDASTGEALPSKEYGELQPVDLAEVDLALFAEALSPRGRERADSPWMVIPVTYRALAHSSSRYRLFQEAHRLTPAERRGFAWEITGLESGIPSSRLAELISLVRRNCRGVVCEFDAAAASVDKLAGSGAILSIPPPSSGWSEYRLLQMEGRIRSLISHIPSLMLRSVPATLAPLANFIGATHCTIAKS